MCGVHARVIPFFARDSALRFLGSENSSQRRHAERTSLGPGLEHPSLRSGSSLAAKRRAEAPHVVFFSTKHPSPARELLLCVYSRMIRIATKDARWVRCSPCSLGPSPRRPTASCSLAAVRRRLRSRIVVVFVVQRIDRYSNSYSYFCTSYCCCTGSAQLDFYFIKERSHFSI